MEATSRNFTIKVDEPTSSGGTNTGMNPVELLLCSFGACQAITAVVYAPQCGVDLQDLWIEVEGDMDSAGMMGYTDFRPGYEKIRFNFHIKSPSPEAKIQKLVNLVEKRCPVADSLKNGVSFEDPVITIES
ncbi:MAG: OsmC family protein [Lachnospiraceae bacterium]|nr:OsmC family protein [Lachnospiraceae bacterium]